MFEVFDKWDVSTLLARLEIEVVVIVRCNKNALRLKIVNPTTPSDSKQS